MSTKNKAKRSVGDSNLMHLTSNRTNSFLNSITMMISAAKNLIEREDVTRQLHPSGAVRAAIDILYFIGVRMCHAVSYVAADGETLPNNFSIQVQIYYDTRKDIT